MRALPTKGAGAQDLVKSRTREEAVQASEKIRLRLGRLEIARNQRLDLVDCLCAEERVGESAKNIQFHPGNLLLTQRHACQRVSQQLHPLFLPPLNHRHAAKT